MARARTPHLMRIAFISPEYPTVTGGGGLGTQTQAVARQLVHRGHEVLVVVIWPTKHEPEDNGVRLEWLARPRVPTFTAKKLLGYRATTEAVLRFRPDVVEAPEWGGDAWWLARRKRVPLVTRLASPTFMLVGKSGERLSLAGRVLDNLERDQARRSDVVLAPSRAVAQLVVDRWHLEHEGIDVVPNGFDLHAVREAGRRQPSVRLPERFLAFFGRIQRLKGADVLAAALPQVLAAHPELQAVFVGDDSRPMAARVRQLVAPFHERVHLLGELRRDDALSVVARAELVAVPSLWEVFAHVVVESMILGRPVVASRAGALPEVVENGRTGFLVPPGDTEALATTVLEALSDGERLRAVGEHAARAAERFSIDTKVDRMLALYEQVAK